MKEDKELTPEHLEFLLKLKVSEKPIAYVDLESHLLRVAPDLAESNLVNKFKESDERYPNQKVSFYQLTPKGEKYINNVLQYASRYFEKIMDSN